MIRSKLLSSSSELRARDIAIMIQLNQNIVLNDVYYPRGKLGFWHPSKGNFTASNCFITGKWNFAYIDKCTKFKSGRRCYWYYKAGKRLWIWTLSEVVKKMSVSWMGIAGGVQVRTENVQGSCRTDQKSVDGLQCWITKQVGLRL